MSDGARSNGGMYSRPRISFIGGRITHNDLPCRVVIRKELVSVGCSDVTPEAIRALLEMYNKHFAQTEYVEQP